MRFLIGIIMGASLSLFIATAVDAPTHSMLNRARAGLEQLWDGIIDTTSDSLFRTDEAVPGNSRSEPIDKGNDEAGLPDTPFLPTVALEPPAEMPPALPAEAPVPRLDPIEEPRVVEEAPLIAAVDPLITVVDELEPADPAEISFATEAISATDPAALATVWAPFHSQMSAEGFAARLSRELDHAFRVERQGAGSYQVVFDAESDLERDLLLAQIAEITGQ